MQNYFKRFFSFLLMFSIIVLPISFAATAADTFENSIKSFPESYKPYLRQLHKTYPNWEFQALDTKLDWYASVDAQYANNRSLFTASTAYTDIFRSREIGDYNYSTGTYIQKDSGFVRANKIAISYFMDPRNFLTAEGIFQFEKLSFDSSITVEDVETALKGSFMYDTKISYYTGTIKTTTDEETGKTTYTLKNKKKVTSSEKYSEAIYNAGKTYNINPCYLVEKIINEVGKNGSNSVSGTQETYPAIYNFYNIGAYDGANALESGLAWAANGYKSASYSRPWNTPQKSISGGAQFIAETYINKGQYTSYLQKFNVDPTASNKVYTHQYMTNISGAASPAYETYKAYTESETISNKHIFVIPIYKNMPSENSTSQSVNTADSINQMGKINTNCNVRKDASVDSELLGVTLSTGTEVKILDTVFTTTKNVDTIMRYPYWCKIQFTNASKTQIGYVYSNFVTITTQTLVGIGSYVPITYSNNSSASFNYISDDVNVATVTNNTVLNFGKVSQSVTISAYNSSNNYERIKYKVVKDVTKYIVENISVSQITYNSAKITFNANTNFVGYEVLVTDKSGNLVSCIQTQTNSTVVSGLKFSSQYNISVRGYTSSKNYGILCGNISFTTMETPEKPTSVTSLSAKNSNITSVVLSWNEVQSVDGYCLYTYNTTNGTYTLLATVSSPSLTYTDTSKNSVNTTVYAIKTFKTVEGVKIYSDYSSPVTYTPITIAVNKPTGLVVKSVTSKTVTLKWNKNTDTAIYNVYKYNSSKKKYAYVAQTTNNSYTVSGLSGNKTYKFIVKAVKKYYDKSYESPSSAILSAKTAPNTTSKIYLSDVTTKSYTLNWKSVKGATGYRVYVYDSSTKKYKKYKNTKNTYMKFSKLSAGQKTYYKIVAYNKTGETTLNGDLSSSFRATTKPAKVTSLSAKSVASKSVKLTWKKATGSTGYRIYSYNSAKGTYKLLGKTTKNSITIKNLSPGKTYKLVVRSVSKTNNTTQYGAFSSKLTVTTKK